MHQPVSTARPSVGHRAVRYLIPLMAAVALTAAFALSGTTGIASAQGDQDFTPVLIKATIDYEATSFLQRKFSCATSLAPVSVDFAGSSHSLVGLCIRQVDNEANKIDLFWDTSVASIGLINAVYVYHGEQSLATLPEPDYSPGNDATWTNRPMTHVVRLTPRQTFGEVFSTATAGNEAYYHRGGDATIINGDVYTLVLAPGKRFKGTPTLPTEVRASPNEEYTERTLTWKTGEHLLKDTEVHREELLSTETGSNLWGNATYLTAQDGVDHILRTFVDSTVDASVTYRYRIRTTSYDDIQSDWTGFVISNEKSRDEPSAVPAVMYPRPDQERFTLADDGSPRGYQFEIIGEDAAWPVQVAIQGDAFRLSATLQTVTDCAGLDDTLSIERDAREFYLYVCEAGDATLLLRSGVDGQLYADYPLFTAATTVAPRPDQPAGELFVDRSGEDHLGISGALEQLFEHTAMNADPVLAKNFLVLVLAVGIGAVPLLRRGRMDVPALTNGFILASLVMWGATIVAGYPVWWAVTPAALLVTVGIIGFASRLRAGR